MLRLMWRGLETELRPGLHGHERGNPGHRQGHDLTGHRASPRPDRCGDFPSSLLFFFKKVTGGDRYFFARRLAAAGFLPFAAWP